MTMVSHSINIYTIAIKSIRNIHAVSTNQIADILHFGDTSINQINAKNMLYILTIVMTCVAPSTGKTA